MENFDEKLTQKEENAENTVVEESTQTETSTTAFSEEQTVVDTVIEENPVDTVGFENIPKPTNENAFEKVYFSPVVPQAKKEPMSKGLRVFCGIMAFVILLTCSCATGYFFGKSSISIKGNKSISLDLSSKPKNTDESTACEIYEKLNKSIVGIEVYNDLGDLAEATGVVYSKDGYIVTNDHIYSEIAAPKFKIYDYEGKEYDAEYVAGDTVSDLALLKAKSGSFAVPEFGDSSELICGENVVAIGRPSDARANSSITKGIISLPKRRMATTSSYTATLIQTDSAINPGSSGGALVNMYGQVIGITSAKLAGVNYDDMGFAIPTVTMKRVVSQLAEKGKVENRAKLGITYTEITSVTAAVNKTNTTGLYIASVSDDSDLAGKVNKGDIITHVGGVEITNSEILLDVIEQSYAGDKITLTIVDSNGNSKDYTVKLKANIGESSYHLNSTEQNSNNQNGNKGGNSSNGTFNFPDGE